MTVLDPATMEPVPADGETIGEIMFRGNITMNGYLKNPAATEEAFAGGWFHSGDLAVMEPDGYVQHQGSLKGRDYFRWREHLLLEVEDVLSAIRRYIRRRWWPSRTRNGARFLAPSSSLNRTQQQPRSRSAISAASRWRVTRFPNRSVRPDRQNFHRQDRRIFVLRERAKNLEERRP